MKNVSYLSDVKDYLNDLVEILFYQEYFGFRETAKEYVNDIVSFIESNIDHYTKHKAPPYFNRYGKNMFYIKYRSNRRTIWYIFFQKKENRYLVRFITNNHAKGQYIRGLK